MKNASSLASSLVRSKGEEAYVEMTCPSVELEAQPFEILEVQTRECSRFNTRGKICKVQLNPPPETPLHDPVTYFVHSVKNLFDHVLEDVGDADMVGITIQNDVNQTDISMGFSFRRKGQ